MNCLHCKFGVRVKDIQRPDRDSLYYGIKLLFGLGGEIAKVTHENIIEIDHNFLECRAVTPQRPKENLIWPIVHRDDWCKSFEKTEKTEADNGTK